MTATTLPRTSGDEREDHATTAGARARDVLQRAELVMLAGMAAQLRKIASSSVTPAMAPASARALISVTLGEAMRQIRPLLDGLPRRRGNRCEPRSCRRRPAPSPEAAESMAATMSALFDQAVRSYFGGDSAALPLPPGNAAALRASQLADAQQVMAAGSYRANRHSSCMTVPDLHVPRSPHLPA